MNKIDPIDNELKHQEYLRGVQDGMTYNRGLWDFDGGQEPEIGHYYICGFREITGLTPKQAELCK